MPSWRDFHRIALILGTILRTIVCIYLQLPGGNHSLAELNASQSEQWWILYPTKSLACAFCTARRWQLCGMVAQLGQTENYSVSSKMHRVWAVTMMCDANAMPSVINCPVHKYQTASPRVLNLLSTLLVHEVPGGPARWMLGRFVFINQQISQVELRYRRNSNIYIPSSRRHRYFLFFPYYTHRQHPDLDVTWLAQKNASRSKTHPITNTTLYFPSGLPSATCNCIIMLTFQM
jgi:hypothetical protein